MKRLMLALILVSGLSHAGEIPLLWDPVDHPDVVGYTVYCGTSPTDVAESTIGSLLGGTRDTILGNVTEFTIPDAMDCATTYACVRARDASSGESGNCSEIISGWPTPEVMHVFIDGSMDGQTNGPGSYNIELRGDNFQAPLIFSFQRNGVEVTGLSVSMIEIPNCRETTALLTIGEGVPEGPLDVVVIAANIFTIIGGGPITIGGSGGLPDVTGACRADDIVNHTDP